MIAALGLALLEPLYNESRRRFSSGDSVMCSALEREPLLRSLLKLKPRERSLGRAAFTALSMLLMVMEGAGLGPPLGSPRLVVMAVRVLQGVGARAEWWPAGGFSVERTLRIKRALALQAYLCAIRQRSDRGRR